MKEYFENKCFSRVNFSEFLFKSGFYQVVSVHSMALTEFFTQDCKTKTKIIPKSFALARTLSKIRNLFEDYKFTTKSAVDQVQR